MCYYSLELKSNVWLYLHMLFYYPFSVPGLLVHMLFNIYHSLAHFVSRLNFMNSLTHLAPI